MSYNSELMFINEELTFNRGGLCSSSFENNCLLNNSRYLNKSEPKVFHSQKNNVSVASNIEYVSGDYLGVIPNNMFFYIKVVRSFFNKSYWRRKCFFKKMQGDLSFSEFLQVRTAVNGVLNNVLCSFKTPYLIKGKLYGLINLKNRLIVLNYSFLELQKHIFNLKPRLYSIASSPLQNKNIQLMVGVVMYLVKEAVVYGPSSCFLCTSYLKRFKVDFTSFKVASKFKLPLHTNKYTRSVFIATGTGLAPFRAFLYDKLILNLKLSVWLLFGEKRRSEDFFYKGEISFFLKKSSISRLDLAFSRDVDTGGGYVLDTLVKKNLVFWSWFKLNTYLYVCGSLAKVGLGVDLVIIKLAQLNFNFAQSHYLLQRAKSLGVLKKDVY